MRDMITEDGWQQERVSPPAQRGADVSEPRLDKKQQSHMVFIPATIYMLMHMRARQQL